MTTTDYIKEALDAAQPSLFDRNYDEASRLIRSAMDTAISDQRINDAAALSSILATYLSLGGDEQAAHGAYRRAEELEPHDVHHQLATAKHLYFQLQRRDEARSRVAMALTSPAASDPHVQHKAAALLGRFALAERLIDDAVRHLREAQDAAVSSNLLPLWWDLQLVKKLAAAERRSESREYLEHLLARARSDGDDRLVEEVATILGSLAS